jgi:hypothetical protein
VVYGQTNPKKNFVTFKKKYIPKPLQNFKIEVVTKQTRKPLQRDHRWIEIAFIHVSK